MIWDRCELPEFNSEVNDPVPKMISDTADVVICGAGPVGLLIALGLAQQGIDTIIIGKEFPQAGDVERTVLTDRWQKKERGGRRRLSAGHAPCTRGLWSFWSSSTLLMR